MNGAARMNGAAPTPNGPLDKHPEPKKQPTPLDRSADSRPEGSPDSLDSKCGSLSRKPSLLHASPSITLDPDAWIAYLVLSGTSVTETMSAICHSAINAARKNFPGSLPDQQIMNMVLRSMAGKLPGFTPETTMLATCFCPDEIQNALGDLSHLLLEQFGKRFDFAGLGGMPFAGKTGFKAFAHHVPKNHNVLIVYGPHVAISPAGDVGLCLREGQDHLSPACGACIGALAHLDAGKPLPAPGSEEYELDFQMNFIKKELQKRLDAIHSHPNGKNVGLPAEAFGIAQKLINGMIDMKELNGGSVVVLGGVQINMPSPLPNFFLPMAFNLHTAGQESESLMGWLHEENLWVDDPSPSHKSIHPLQGPSSMRRASSLRRSSKFTGDAVKVTGDAVVNSSRPRAGPARPSGTMPPVRGGRKLTDAP